MNNNENSTEKQIKNPINIMWFRRDLRLSDNAALFHALKSENNIVPIFIFDKNILDRLEDKTDKRVLFIHNALSEMQQQLISTGSTLRVFYTTPIEAFKMLLTQYKIEKVFTNHDYEQYAIDRDSNIAELLKAHQVSFHTFKDQVIFEKEEVTKDDGNPYTVFTPYSKKWKATLTPYSLEAYPTENYFSNFLKQSPISLPTLNDIGFESSEQMFPTNKLDSTLVSHYADRRNFPSLNGTSHLGVHLRFGTVSIREVARKSQNLSETFLNELIWRDFYHCILWHYPKLNKGESFKKEYDQIEWINNPHDFEKWCNGMTGYPIVDAGMRELNATGFMHNRVRMIVASFLTKHLLIDWRWGELYFAQKLLDFDFAANNGGWQWAAGSGCDAAPYFRVFNPTLQTEKFDKDLIYIRKWIPELESFNYPQPIVNHEFARKRVLEVYSKALKRE